MSEWCYRELLWHILLRGTDTFFLWCAKNEQAKEVELLHPVWAAAQEYGEFLEKGTPVNFDVPNRPGPVISGLRIDNQILIRRTDFTEDRAPVKIHIAGKTLTVPALKDQCQILSLQN